MQKYTERNNLGWKCKEVPRVKVVGRYVSLAVGISHWARLDKIAGWEHCPGEHSALSETSLLAYNLPLKLRCESHRRFVRLTAYVAGSFPVDRLLSTLLCRN
ncbi:hypothetical protein CPAR01_15269 [Colletotrichum paranaense]|uniref:Uncharacterized protein n=1 Tax=Colletotrichum paranaense TaxID=1914294 RepID=A0ABQ9RZW4_9PEZI|nr:uncharacterized protein CPAR01_15269 [Colletotrichum paranaense]KAK1520218.1 hypothetical protein CPAR01_15269 [Colletotrichum paranaense]